MSDWLRAKVKEIAQSRLQQMEADAGIALLELSASFRRHVNGALREMFILMSLPRHEDPEWRRKLHVIARDMQSIGGTFDYGLLITIGEVMCKTVKDEALATEGRLQRRLAAYAAALDAVIRVDLQGDGGAHGQELLSVLKIDAPAA